LTLSNIFFYNFFIIFQREIKYINKISYENSISIIGDWGLGIGDWGLGIGPNPNPQSPIPNPQSPINTSIISIIQKKRIYIKKFL
jgi:hypothetical protein